MFKRRRKKIIDQVIYRIEHKNLFERYLKLIIGSLLISLAFNVFFSPRNIVYGGVAGISIVMNNLFGMNPAVFVFISSMFLLVLSSLTLGFEKTKGSIFGSIVYPICIQLTAPIASYIDLNTDNLLLICIFGAVVTGAGAGINFKSGFTTGGTDILNQIIAKYTKVSLGKAMLMSDGLIVVGAGFFLNDQIYAWENVMVAIIVLYIIGFITDKVVLGISQSKAFYIITSKEQEVKEFVMNYLSHGVTFLEGRGGYTGDSQKIIMCIIPTKEYFLAKEGIHGIDPDAFFLVTDAYEIYGGK